ncbi:MAG: nuclear transport factor 2 family protein [Betaproteobacteria bacterium]|nr:nuclear transport factor 2 family protein [Betaproteobacteria bacterium]
MPIDTLHAWHAIVAARDAAGLDGLLADDVVFHSPVVHTPQRGKPLTNMYLGAAMRVFTAEAFRYVREVARGNDAVLEFEAQIDGILVNGVDMIKWDAEGRIVDFKVMIRPLKAIEVVHRKMAEMLAAGRRA